MSEPTDEEIKAAARRLGKLGGPARAAKLSAERRREIARMGGRAGKRRPASAPKKEVRRCFVINDSDYRTLRNLGEGNASSGLRRLLEIHAAEITRQVSERPPDEGYSDLLE